MDPGGPNPGTCCRCGQRAAHRALIAIIETGSGPGGSAYACLPCAREYAATSLAPGWLDEVLRRAEAGAEVPWELARAEELERAEAEAVSGPESGGSPAGG